jgi:uncharacterized protein (TIGR04255 family)
MKRKILKNKPLVEALLEVRWKLRGEPDGQQIDPHYKLLLGRFFDRISDRYPEHEQLPTASIPDELVGHVVQHRFRAGPKQWPLVQLGPGIFTFNSTADYTWEAFHPRVVDAVATLFESHPKREELRVTDLILRYIDAVDFDHESESAFTFLRDMLKVDLKLPDSLFDGTNVAERPLSLSWQTSFRCHAPKGAVAIKLGLGQKDGNRALLWDTSIQATGVDVPALPEGFTEWIEAAHGVTSDWFFKLIDGELERRFSGA